MINSVGAISLGCSKNRVDTETLLGYLVDYGFNIEQKPELADILIVNTCGFITSAKAESIETILELAAYRENGRCRLLVVTGCLSQRYMNDLINEMPEVDLFWGVRDYENLAAKIAKLSGKPERVPCNHAKRLLTTPPYSAYLRIADGCNNRCTYCAIPLIRGKLESVPIDALISEARELACGGVKELCVIAQDTTGYGVDLYGKPMLKQLLKKLTQVDGLEWIRLLYAYPDTVDEELIELIVNEPKLVNYIDMPIQHISDRLLKSMNRRGNAAHIRRMFGLMRAASPDFIIRTTLMVGFPGETETEFGQLAELLAEYELDRVGAFAFSPEESTEAATLVNQLDEDLKLKRLNTIMGVQQAISRELNHKKRLGKEYKVLLSAISNGKGYGRSYAEAPEVDGLIEFSMLPGEHKLGEFYNVRITETGAYDLWGEQI